MNPEQFPATVSGALRNYVTGVNWEGALGDEAKPGDLPVTQNRKTCGRDRLVCVFVYIPPASSGRFFFLKGGYFMKNKLVLVTGGARSGKSTFAEKYVLHYSPKCDYIATAEILDDEMADRVRLHQERRNDGRWVNHEAPYHAEEEFANLGEDTGAVLFDCLTLYMSNQMYGKTAIEGSFPERCNFVLNEIDKVLEAAKSCGKLVVFVSNEVGGGIVPDNVMAREYRDLAGWVNQKVAAACDKVFYCVAGQAVDVKKLAFKFEEEE